MQSERILKALVIRLRIKMETDYSEIIESLERIEAILDSILVRVVNVEDKITLLRA